MFVRKQKRETVTDIMY